VKKVCLHDAVTAHVMRPCVSSRQVRRDDDKAISVVSAVCVGLVYFSVSRTCRASCLAGLHGLVELLRLADSLRSTATD